MTVYVDDMDAPYRPPHCPDRIYVMSHMIADTEAELHRMARRIGVARRWFQKGDHYDITKTKKKEAIAAGAVLIPWRTLAIMANNRRAGYPLGSPESCERIARQRFRRRRS